jgi:hypothetical protein
MHICVLLCSLVLTLVSFIFSYLKKKFELPRIAQLMLNPDLYPE